MNNQTPNTIRGAVRAMLLKQLNPPPVNKDEIKAPSNSALTHALVDFNLFFFILDLISAGIVGWLTFWFYGILALIAGIYPMFAWERKYTRAKNSKVQKVISGFGIGLGALSTIVIAVLSAIVSLLKVNTIMGVDVFATSIAIILVSIIFVHGVMNGVYVFIDRDIKANQTLAEKMAIQQDALRDVRHAGVLGEAALEVETKLNEQLSKEHGEFVKASLESLSGNSLLIPNEVKSNPNQNP